MKDKRAYPSLSRSAGNTGSLGRPLGFKRNMLLGRLIGMEIWLYVFKNDGCKYLKLSDADENLNGGIDDFGREALRGFFKIERFTSPCSKD